MTTTPTRVTAGLEAHGLDPVGTIVWSPTTAQLYTAALKSGDGALAHGGPLVVDTGTFTGRSPKDKFVVDEPGSRDRIWWGDINHPLPEDRFRRPAHEGRRAPRRRVIRSTSSTPSPAPIMPTASVSASSPAAPTTRCSRRRCSSHPLRRSSRSFAPDVLVLHAPAVEADPATDGTRTGTFVALHPTQGEVLIGGTFYARRDQEGDLHGDERSPAARRRPADALLGERRRGRQGRGLLRPLRHRQDDPLRRPVPLADRRRRARLGRERRLQHRGRLLREGDPPLGRGRAGDLPDDEDLRHCARERRRRRARRGRSRRRLEDREHARGVQARADLECGPDEDGGPPDAPS